MYKSRVWDAAQKYGNGFNCSQAVACTYCDLVGVEKTEMFKIAEGFGSGMSGMGETCGCVCAMILLAGLKNSDGGLEASKTKGATFAAVRTLADEFKNMNTTINCTELRGDEKSGKLRSCRGCVIDASRIIEERLFPGMFEKYDGAME